MAGALRVLGPDQEVLTLGDVASHLGVHYMTVYRYVRTGRLKAERQGGRWLVAADELQRLAPTPTPKSGGRRRGRAERADRLLGRLMAGDGPGCWAVIEDGLAAGSPLDVYLQLLAPSLRALGEGWANGNVSISQEHRATALAIRLVGRISPLFARPGRRRPGTVVVAGATGDIHVLPVIMVSDALRGEGFSVVDLGADVPRQSVLEVVTSLPDPLALGLSLSVDGYGPGVARTVAAVREARPEVIVLVGGPAVRSRADALKLGSDHWAADAAGAAQLLLQLTAPEYSMSTP